MGRRQRVYAIRRKLKLVLALGGGCQICGYNKNLGSLAFHHVKAEEKEFSLSGRELANRSWKLILAEVEKCVLLCHNCHGEMHWPDMNLPDLDSDSASLPELVPRSVTSYFCMDCGASLKKKAKRCLTCNGRAQEKIKWPPISELRRMVSETSYRGAGRALGVSDNAVRKRLQKYG